MRCHGSSGLAARACAACCSNDETRSKSMCVCSSSGYAHGSMSSSADAAAEAAGADCAGAARCTASASDVASPAAALCSLGSRSARPAICDCRLPVSSCALMRCCWSAGSLLSGGATWPSAIFSVGASATCGPNTRCTWARRISTTFVVPSTLSALTASANAYLLIGVSNLIHRRERPLRGSCARLMRGTLVRSTYARTSAGRPRTNASQRSSGLPSGWADCADWAGVRAVMSGQPDCTGAADGSGAACGWAAGCAVDCAGAFCCGEAGCCADCAGAVCCWALA